MSYTRSSTPSVSTLILLSIFLLLTAFAYEPAWHGEPVWDDPAHLTPTDMRTVEGLKRIWLDPEATQQYYPVTHTAFWIIGVLFGDSLFAHHIVNITLHAASALLLVMLMRRVGLRGEMLAAVLFALHPVHVESVAWMSELKNTLSLFLCLSAALAYLRFDATRHTPAYVLSLILFVAAVLSKSVTATLPAALLVTSWWRHGRLEVRRDLFPLLPMVVIGIVAGSITVWMEYHQIGARGSDFELTFIERTLLAGRAIWFYLYTWAWPRDLAFIYPRWEISAAVWWQYLFPAAVLAVAGLLWRVRTWSRGPVAAFAIYCLTLAPALGFVNVYPFKFSYVANHFQYHATVALTIFVASAIAWLWPRPGRAYAAAVLVAAVCLGAATRIEARTYESPETLYRTTLDRNPAAWLAHTNLSALLLSTPTNPNVEAAVSHSTAAVHLDPDDAQVRYNLGLALHLSGAGDRALAEYHEALRLEPGHAKARNNLASLLASMGRHEEAVEQYRSALQFDPSNVEARQNLGMLLARLGRYPEAVPHLRRAAAAAQTGDSYVHLGAVLADAGRIEEAKKALTHAASLAPEDARVWRVLGDLALHGGHPEEAIAHYQQAEERAPEDAGIQNALGVAHARMGAHAEAVEFFAEALCLAPRLTEAKGNLGLSYAAMDRLPESLRSFQMALQDQPSNPEWHYYIGVTLARLGRLQDAIEHLNAALDIDPEHRSSQEALRTLKREMMRSRGGS
ncbi:MAG TPA: tetratricopeptide repeat protein [Vicinamibacterales bacterium]